MMDWLADWRPYDGWAEQLAALQDEGFASVEQAREFDQKIAPLFGYDLMEYIVLDRAKGAAQAALVHDPLNPQLLDVVGRQSMRAVKTDTSYTLTPRARKMIPAAPRWRSITGMRRHAGPARKRALRRWTVCSLMRSRCRLSRTTGHWLRG